MDLVGKLFRKMDSNQMAVNAVTLFSFILLLGLDGHAQVLKGQCGFPGTPAFGFVKPDEDLYSEGEVVTYSCRVGYILLGSPIRRCKDDGSWTEEIPICDDSMTTLGFASSTSAMPGHPAELAIDRDKDTCTYLDAKNTRWWRIDLGDDYKVLSVTVTVADTDKYTKFTVFVIKIQDSNASYKRCASFSGKFGTPTVVLTCAAGRGIIGQQVHVEDHMHTGVFELCEVEVQVEKDTGYECGRPERNPNSITFDVEGDQVEYGCLTGYELEGREYRQCLSNGQWTGKAPICEAIVCEPLLPLENGELKLSVINDGDVPLEGTIANYNCDEGYKLLGDFNRICLKDGTWSGKQPQCEAVRCPVPDAEVLGGVYRLVNRTTRMGSMAMLKCRKGKMEGNNPFIICTEEGDWTEPQSRCLIPSRAGTASTEGPKIEKKEAIIFGMVVAGIMMTIVLVSLYIITQRRRRARKPALPCRQIESPDAPPRPPPRSKGALASTLLECVTGSSEKLYGYGSDDKENETLLKTRSLPLKNIENSEWQAQSSPNRATSLDRPFHEDVAEDHHEKSPSSQAEEGETADDTNAVEEGEVEATEITDKEEPADQEQDQESQTPSESKTGPVAGREYAAVDYEKKRQSRLQKEQSADEGTPEQSTSPVHDEDENATPPMVPPKEAESSLDMKSESGKETPSAVPASPEPEEKAAVDSETSGKTERSRTRPSDADQPDTDKGSRRQRRTRGQAETPPEPEEKPTTRGARRTRVRE